MDALLMASEAHRNANTGRTIVRFGGREMLQSFMKEIGMLPVENHYESPTMNRKLAAAKQWLAEHSH